MMSEETPGSQGLTEIKETGPTPSLSLLYTVTTGV